MECKEAKEYLCSLVDKELSGDLLRRVEKHLNACENCSRKRLFLTRLKGLLSTRIRTYSAPTTLREHVLAGIAEQPTRGVFFSQLLSKLRSRPLAASVVGSIIFLALLISLFSISTSRGMPPLISEAYAHHLEFEKHEIDIKITDINQIAEFTKSKCGHPIFVPDLSDKDFTLLGCTRHKIWDKDRLWVKYACGDKYISIFACVSDGFKFSAGNVKKFGKILVSSSAVGKGSVAVWEKDGACYVMVGLCSEKKLLSLLEFAMKKDSE